MQKILISTLRYCVFLLLFWKGMTHFSSDQPYEYVFDNDYFIRFYAGFILIAVSATALLPLSMLKFPNFKWGFFIASIILAIHSYCGYVKVGYLPEQFVEHSLQMALPIMLFLQLYNEERTFTYVVFGLRVALALTFVGHGTYALGYHILPDHFVKMTNTILRMEGELAKQFLFIIGLIDMAVAILMFIPKTQKAALAYMFIWGILTAFARPVSQLGEIQNMEFYTIHLPNALYRLPHGLIPLCLYVLSTKKGYIKQYKPSFF
ncbi:MAG: hypothetical protein ACI9XP_000014 [Lentimonas sp.]|jgi:hypothetical protein